MSTEQTSQTQTEENRYQLVNNIAKRAKVLISHDPAAQLSNHRAIHEAMQQEDELPVHSSQLSS